VDAQGIRAKLRRGRSPAAVARRGTRLACGDQSGIACWPGLLRRASVVTLLSAAERSASGVAPCCPTRSRVARFRWRTSLRYKMGLHRYDFVVPCLVVAGAEIAVFSFWHPTLAVAVAVLATGHVAVLGANAVAA